MPVLSESDSNPSKHEVEVAPCSTMFSRLALPHILVAFILLSGLLILVRRKLARNKLMQTQREDEEEFRDEKILPPSDFQYQFQEPLLSLRSPTTTSPTLDETNLTNVRNLESVPASPISSSPSTFNSFQPTPIITDIPRRRSYTKTINGGTEIEVEVTGEIVVSPEGWRRHTRVFGGGVCKACEESERRMSA